jgi:hypothetical protein
MLSWSPDKVQFGSAAVGKGTTRAVEYRSAEDAGAWVPGIPARVQLCIYF